MQGSADRHTKGANMPLTKLELIEALRDVDDDAIIYVASASSGVHARQAAIFRLLDVDTKHCVLVASNYVERYVPANYPDRDERGDDEDWREKK
jgi:hypothetical protein